MRKMLTDKEQIFYKKHIFNEEELNIKIANKIKKIRNDKLLSQEMFGKKVKWTRSKIMHIEKGENTLSLWDAYKLASYLNLNIDNMIFDDNNDISENNLIQFLLANKDKISNEKEKEILNYVKYIVQEK